MELLVVIGIIAILVSISFFSYSTAQKSSRDQRRKEDLSFLQHAFEQYYTDNVSAYSATCDPGTVYLPSGAPDDPKTGDPYSMVCTTSTYCICAGLESAVGNASTDCSGVEGNYFCVYNTQ